MHCRGTICRRGPGMCWGSPGIRSDVSLANEQVAAVCPQVPQGITNHETFLPRSDGRSPVSRHPATIKYSVGRRAEAASCSRGGAPARGARPPGRQPPPPGIRASGNWGPHCVVRQWGYQVVPCAHVHVLPFQSLLRNPQAVCFPNLKQWQRVGRRKTNGLTTGSNKEQRESPHSFPSLPLPPAKHAATRRTRRTANVGGEGGRPQGTGKEKDKQDGGGGSKRRAAARCVPSPHPCTPAWVRRPFAGRLARTAAQACRASRAPAAFARGPLALEHGVAGEPRMQPTSSQI